MQCPACGLDVVEQAVYCHKCGERLDAFADQSAHNPRRADDFAGPANAFERETSLRRDTRDLPEEELWHGGYSSKAMVGAWIASGLVSVLLLAVGVLWARTAIWWLILIALVVLPWLYYFAVLCYRRWSVRYILTNQRFVHETGILRRVNDRIELLDMDDIAFEQGLIERLVGVGTIRIVSSDRSHPDFALLGIENVKVVAELFDNARRAERRRRGLHVESI